MLKVESFVLCWCSSGALMEQGTPVDNDKKEAAFVLEEDGMQGIILSDVAGQALSSLLSVTEQVPCLCLLLSHTMY